jgi:4-hydroxy-3-methylbut-2-enyl diphosphate reductase
VNADLLSHGIQFIQDTKGNQLIPWNDLRADDIVIIPAFGTTLEIESILSDIGVNVSKYNTTCPFVEKVWNRSEKLGSDEHTIIIHGKHNHEETRATFSHSRENAPALILKNLEEAKLLGDLILGERSTSDFYELFDGKYSQGFEPEKHLTKIGVVNQTTMLATETQEITDYLRDVMIQKFGNENIKNHIADTRDTLCYATNDNQSATYGLLEKEADFALVVGGYNSSNTTHLVELLEQKFQTYFIKDQEEVVSDEKINSFNIHSHTLETLDFNLQATEKPTIIITSGASCPDAIVDGVIQRIVEFKNASIPVQSAIENFLSVKSENK